MIRIKILHQSYYLRTSQLLPLMVRVKLTLMRLNNYFYIPIRTTYTRNFNNLRSDYKKFLLRFAICTRNLFRYYEYEKKNTHSLLQPDFNVASAC